MPSRVLTHIYPICILLQALEKQKEQLLEHEGAGSSYMPDINKDLDFVRDVNCAKADKAAAKLA